MGRSDNMIIPWYIYTPISNYSYSDVLMVMSLLLPKQNICHATILTTDKSWVLQFCRFAVQLFWLLTVLQSSDFRISLRDTRLLVFRAAVQSSSWRAPLQPPSAASCGRGRTRPPRCRRGSPHGSATRSSAIWRTFCKVISIAVSALKSLPLIIFMNIAVIKRWDLHFPPVHLLQEFAPDAESSLSRAGHEILLIVRTSTSLTHSHLHLRIIYLISNVLTSCV